MRATKDTFIFGGMLLAALVSVAYGQGFRGGMMSDAYVAAWARATRGVDNNFDAGLINGLVTYWSMDSRSGDDVTVFDTKGSNDGTAANAPTFSEANGVFNDGVGMNGTNQRIDLGNVLNMGTNSMTISMWANMASVPAASPALVTKTIIGNEANRWSSFILTSRAPHMSFTSADNQTVNLTAATIINLNQWYHLVFVFDRSGNMQIYIDGNKDANEASMSALAGQNITSTRQARIGAANASNGTSPDRHFPGSLDEVAIWNRALSSNEVSEIYNDGKGRFYKP